MQRKRSPKELAGRRVAVIGMGRTGLAAARFLRDSDADVLLVDTRPAGELGERLSAAEQLGVDVRAECRQLPAGGRLDLAIISPGLSIHNGMVARAVGEGLQVISEVELASWFCSPPIVAVSGTNGKGTTCTLLGEMLEAGGKRTVVAGNVGTPLIAEIDRINESDVLVAEISSFQLEGIETFRPAVAVLLNITPDHLERHGTFEAYLAAKSRLFVNQTDEDLAVLNGDDSNVLQAARDGRARRAFFTLNGRPDCGGWVRDGQLMLDLGDRDGEEALCAVADVPVPGPHNLRNVLAAGIAAWTMGAPPEAVVRAVRQYRPQRYVLEKVADIAGVAFVNDSKATNEAAAAAALEAVSGRILLIAGGSDKGADFREFAETAARRVKAAFLIGECGPRIADRLREANGPPAQLCEGLRDAVQRAWRAAEPGDTVLMAPACASFDQFRDYADRGAQFTRIVEDIKAGDGSADPGGPGAPDN